MAKDKLLIINTSEIGKIFLGLAKDDFFIDKVTKKSNKNRSEILVSEIEKLLKKNKSELKSLKGIVAFRGPGSYTGLKIGLTIANVMAWSLDIPVIGITGKDLDLKNLKTQVRKADKKFNKIIEPDYSEQAYYE